MGVGERTLPGVTDGLYSEAVAAGLGQSLDLVGVAGSAVDRHKPGEGQHNRHVRRGTNESQIERDENSGRGRRNRKRNVSRRRGRR